MCFQAYPVNASFPFSILVDCDTPVSFPLPLRAEAEPFMPILLSQTRLSSDGATSFEVLCTPFPDNKHTIGSKTKTLIETSCSNPPISCAQKNGAAIFESTHPREVEELTALSAGAARGVTRKSKQVFCKPRNQLEEQSSESRPKYSPIESGEMCSTRFSSAQMEIKEMLESIDDSFFDDCP
jgi:hypothetical protein